MSFTLNETLSGKYRWDIKLLIDTAGQRVLNLPSHQSSVHELVSIHRPSNDQLGEHRAEAEKKKITITAFIVESGKEDDGDFHLVLTDESNSDSLIAEIPDPSSPELQNFPEQKKEFNEARNFFLQHVEDHPGNIKPLPHHVKANITGVVFFDKMAHGNGHAKNGVEIHPILKIESTN